MSKRIIGGVLVLILMTVSIVLITYNWGGSQELVKNKTEPDISGDSPENVSVEDYIKRARAYERDGKYEEAIIEMEKAVELFPEDRRGYSVLRAFYILTSRYTKAFEVNYKIIKMMESMNLPVCKDIETNALIFEYAGKQDGAIDFLEEYRESCPKTVEWLVNSLKEAKSRGDNFFPPVVP